MTEQEWWETAPNYANYHTWDRYGKVWWKSKPTFGFYSENPDAWSTDYRKPLGSIFDHYDQTPLPIEIDPAKTLRKRPKE
jgi:hypothetical protein